MVKTPFFHNCCMQFLHTTRCNNCRFSNMLKSKWGRAAVTSELFECQLLRSLSDACHSMGQFHQRRSTRWTEVTCGDKLRLELTHVGETGPMSSTCGFLLRDCTGCESLSAYVLGRDRWLPDICWSRCMDRRWALRHSVNSQFYHGICEYNTQSALQFCGKMANSPHSSLSHSETEFFQLADGTAGLRGHSLKLFKPRCCKTVRQNFLSLHNAQWME